MKREYFRLTLALVVCIDAAQLAHGQSGVQVAIVFNSGFQNTIFGLTDTQANIILGEIQGLPQTQDPQWTWAGWRGFQVENLGSLSATVAQIVVLDGVLRVDYADGTSLFFSDLGYEVQSFLCQAAGSAFPAGAACLPSASAPTLWQSAEVEPPAKSPWPRSFLNNPYNPAFWNM